MSIFTNAESGVSSYKTLFALKDKVVADCNIGRVTPLHCDFCLPGDIWHKKQNLFIRTQAMFAPLLTDLNATVRSFFVPLRLIEEDTELTITGSNNGKFSSDVVLPDFKAMFDDATDYTVEKYSALDYMMSLPIGNYNAIKNNDCMPAQYWLKAYARIWFDWYRDENLSEYDDFDTFWNTWKTQPGKIKPFYSNWKKDYFTGSLPFQQKGIMPAYDLSITNSAGSSFFNLTLQDKTSVNFIAPITGAGAVGSLGVSPAATGVSSPQNVGIDMSGAGGQLTMPDIRILGQQQRIMERLARCGSRYTEYLQSNFGIAPSDGTLQRAQYLGGYVQPIVSSEVMQTAADGTTPVGTLRGKGISMASNHLETFVCKEFGVIIDVLSVMPKATYTQGIPRQYTYKKRFDFFNPSLQNLSEQEIRNGELYVDFTDSDVNDETFAFNEMYSELKIGRDRVCGDMRDTQSYWTMARYFSDTPVLGESFVQAQDSAAFAAPFAVTDKPPLIVEYGTINSVYRPMTRYGTPGLVDHN